MKNSNVNNTPMNTVQMEYWNPWKMESRRLVWHIPHIIETWDICIINGMVSIVSGLKHNNKKEGMVLITRMIVPINIILLIR